MKKTKPICSRIAALLCCIYLLGLTVTGVLHPLSHIHSLFCGDGQMTVRNSSETDQQAFIIQEKVSLQAGKPHSCVLCQWNIHSEFTLGIPVCQSIYRHIAACISEKHAAHYAFLFYHSALLRGPPVIS